jgi:hypothetical protein
VLFCGSPLSVNVTMFRPRVAITLKPDSGAVLRSTACETSEPASVHASRIWLLDNVLAVRFVGGVSRASLGRRRPSPLERQSATPSRRQARRICVRHWRFDPPASTQAAMSSWQLSRHTRAIEAASAGADMASSMRSPIPTPTMETPSARRRGRCSNVCRVSLPMSAIR